LIRVNDRRQQVIRLERELAAAKAAAEFTKLSANDHDKNANELQERFVKYETELSAANRKIADCNMHI
jgi:molybdopterin-biosynthesis enzyme MoeA-like protein